MSSEMQKMNGSQSASNIPKRVGESDRGRTKGDPIADQDSGHFSSDEGSPRPPNLHQATSDDELSMEELRRRQRKERRDYLQRHSPIKGSSSRKESPSPAGPRYIGERGRRSSDDGTSDTSSLSPPPTPSIKTRSTSSRPWGMSPGLNLSNRRAKSSGNSPKKLQLGVKTCPYAFGSSQKRFFDDGTPIPPLTPSPEGSLYSGSEVRRVKSNQLTSPTSTLQKKPSPLNKSSSDGVQNSIHLQRGSDSALNRASSDSKVSSGKRGFDATKESWLKFKDDVDSALQKKPNQAGFYKNLADMMHNKMEMLDNDKVRMKEKSSSVFFSQTN